MPQQGVHYFPGHMQKALRQIEGYIKAVDMVVELLDARAPLASENPLIASRIKDKARLVLLSKEDYADPEVTKRYVEAYQKRGIIAVPADLKRGRIIKLLQTASAPLIAKKR